MAKVTEGLWNSKKLAREQALSRLGRMSDQDWIGAQTDFSFQLDSFLKTCQGCWGAYRPKKGEVSPSNSIQNHSHLRWAYPRVFKEALEFYLEPKVWRSGAFGIEEPDPETSESIPVFELNGLLIPGLAFDRTGTRLGRGRGYFDRALKDYKGIKVGVAFEGQMVSEPLPRESFDIPMDLIITDRGIYTVKSEGDRRND